MKILRHDWMPIRTRAASTLLLLCAAPCATSAQSLTYLVGADSAVCDHADLQTAIDRAQNHPGPDTIRVASNQSYTGLALKIGAQDLVIEGGYASCADALVATEPPTGRTSLSGQGAPQDSVLEITGVGIRGLRGLTISRGDDPLSGGGIQFEGAGQLLLENVGITNNLTSHGGGINFHGTGAAALVLGPDVQIQNNTASESGGGIRVTGNGHLEMIHEGTLVSGNEAQGLSSDQQGHGGGILVIGPARADIAAPGNDVAGTIFNNTAKYGGGLAVIAPDADARVHLYSVDPQQPLGLFGNRASALGGAIYVGGDESFGGAHQAVVCAAHYRIEDNVAPEGAAIAVAEAAAFTPETGGFAFNHCSSPPTAGAVPCPAGGVCSTLAGNRSELLGASTGGATLYVKDDSSFARLSRVAVTSNAGGSVARGSNVDVIDSLLADNALSGALAVLTGGGDEWRQLTIAGNQIDADHVFEVGAAVLTLQGSIIEQPGKRIVALDGGSLEAQDLLVNSCGLIDCSGFPNVTARASGPRFVDAEAGDYRLHAASVAVDFAEPVVGDDRDLDGNPRDQDLLPKPNRGGVRDLGAYERQEVGDLTRNPYFESDLRFWTRVTPAATLQHVPGGADTPGALRIADTIDTQAGEVIARQCVPLPGPGRYALSARARVDPTPSPLFARDRASIRWRHVSSPTANDCTGPSLHSGELQFASTTTFSEPLNPDDGTFDSISADEFSQVEIQLVATEGSVSLVDPTAAEFDDVRLLYAGAPSGRIFADSFE